MKQNSQALTIRAWVFDILKHYFSVCNFDPKCCVYKVYACKSRQITLKIYRKESLLGIGKDLGRRGANNILESEGQISFFGPGQIYQFCFASFIWNILHILCIKLSGSDCRCKWFYSALALTFAIFGLIKRECRWNEKI